MSEIKIEHILFIDLETAPIQYRYNELSQTTKELWDKKMLYVKDTTPEQHYAKAGVFAEFAKVVCIGLGFMSNGKFRTKAIAGENEKEILMEFSSLMKSHFYKEEHFLCAHNGKEFDYPFLCRRLLVNQLPLPKLLQIQGFKPWNVKHLDTMEMWRFGDIKNFTSLNLLAHIFNIPSPKDDMDGSMVSKVYHEDDNIEKIKKYCLKDVVTLARVYQKYTNQTMLTEKDIVFA